MERNTTGGRKRTCKFTEELEKEFSFKKKTKNEGTVYCEKCNGEFSVTHGGKFDVRKHLTTEKHKRAVSQAASSLKVDQYFRKSSFETKERELAIAEGLYCFHTISHNQSFRSMDCTSKIIQKLFDRKFSCARTKTEAIVCNVFSKFAFSQLKNELQETSFLSIYSDTSNHKDQKLFPIVIRFFNPNSGIRIRILDFISLPGETSQLIFNCLIEILERHNLKEKLVAYSADNTNSNFGGRERRGCQNVFHKLNESVENKITGVGCAAHIVHNAIKTATDLLPVDIESIIIKIYSYFYIYTVRVESLKDFCESTDVEYQKLLGYSKTRWLALLPAIERILKLYKPLKSYFESQEKCPRSIENFFNNDQAELWLKFLHNQASLFQSTIKNIEGEKVTIIDTAEEINSLILRCRERLDNEYVPLIIKKDLQILEKNGAINLTWFKSHVRNFYNTCVEYLEKWAYPIKNDNIRSLNWIILKKVFDWQAVEKSFEYISSNINQLNIDENELFDEVIYVKRYCDENKIKDWNNQNIEPDLRWVEIINHFKQNGIPFKNVLKLVEYTLALPGTNAPIERVFSLVNKIWTIEKAQLKVETIKSILSIKYNLTGSCEEFHQLLIENPEIIKEIHSSKKYV